eukprot:jgi/Hompol1/2851/HPOL_006193-RA
MTADLDWKNLGFRAHPMRSHIEYHYKDGVWDNGTLVTDTTLQFDVWAAVVHYGASAFEGLKAMRMKDGKARILACFSCFYCFVRIFRPDLNAQRMAVSCEAASMIAPPQELFVEAIVRLVKDNIDYVPPYGTSGSLYIRPLVVGTGSHVGLQPSGEFRFIVIATPVGDFFTGGPVRPIKALIQHGFDRAAPRGMGHAKLGGNYAPTHRPTMRANAKGYSVLLFLDPKESKYVDEFAVSNFAALTREDADGRRTYVTPRSRSILASITN